MEDSRCEDQNRFLNGGCQRLAVLWFDAAVFVVCVYWCAIAIVVVVVDGDRRQY